MKTSSPVAWPGIVVDDDAAPRRLRGRSGPACVAEVPEQERGGHPAKDGWTRNDQASVVERERGARNQSDAGAAKGKRRRAKSVPTTGPTAGTASHGVARLGCSRA